MSSTNQVRLLDEWSTADKNSRLLSEDERCRWQNCKSSHRFLAFRGKKLVAYQLIASNPEIVDTFTCRGLDVSLVSGLSSLWESQKSNKQFWVSSVPVEVAPSCFLWMLKYSSLEFTDYKDSKSLKFSLAYKTVANPKLKVDGTYYLLEKAAFDFYNFAPTPD